MDRENRFQRTPGRTDRSEKKEELDSLDRTGEKLNPKDDPLIESKYELNENAR